MNGRHTKEDMFEKLIGWDASDRNAAGSICFCMSRNCGYRLLHIICSQSNNEKYSSPFAHFRFQTCGCNMQTWGNMFDISAVADMSTVAEPCCARRAQDTFVCLLTILHTMSKKLPPKKLHQCKEPQAPVNRSQGFSFNSQSLSYGSLLRESDPPRRLTVAVVVLVAR